MNHAVPNQSDHPPVEDGPVVYPANVLTLDLLLVCFSLS